MPPRPSWWPICPSCGRDVSKMGPDSRHRMTTGEHAGSMSHLEYDPERGTILVIEATLAS